MTGGAGTPAFVPSSRMSGLNREATARAIAGSRLVKPDASQEGVRPKSDDRSKAVRFTIKHRNHIEFKCTLKRRSRCDRRARWQNPFLQRVADHREPLDASVCVVPTNPVQSHQDIGEGEDVPRHASTISG